MATATSPVADAQHAHDVLRSLFDSTISTYQMLLRCRDPDDKWLSKGISYADAHGPTERPIDTSDGLAKELAAFWKGLKQDLLPAWVVIEGPLLPHLVALHRNGPFQVHNWGEVTSYSEAVVEMAENLDRLLDDHCLLLLDPITASLLCDRRPLQPLGSIIEQKKRLRADQDRFEHAWFAIERDKGFSDWSTRVTIDNWQSRVRHEWLTVTSDVARLHAFESDHERPRSPSRQRKEKPFAPSPAALQVLQSLLNYDPDSMTQAELVEEAGWTHDVVVRELKLLRAADLVTRPTGRKQGNVLTDKGRSYLANLGDRPGTK